MTTAGGGISRPEALPAVGRLIETARFRELVARFGRPLVVGALRAEIGEARRALLAGVMPDAATADAAEFFAHAVETRIVRAKGPVLRRVINATGVVVHTNLGRAPLSNAAAAAVFRAASGYSDLEFDLRTGERGDRSDHVEGLFARLFPNTRSLLAGNAAGAVLLALDTLARGRDVVVSRGELVEIGGSFRIPEILERSGARLVEVGATNRTRLSDYRQALGRNQGRIGALLKVHASNFRITGFTESVGTGALAKLGAETGVPVIEDFGSGNLAPLSAMGVLSAEGEPSLPDRVAAGADLIAFSGDKLLGGPQAGILLGTPEAIEACRRNPLARALRPDKLAIAGLQATLWSHVAGRADTEIPVLRCIARPPAEIRERANALAGRLRRRLADAGGRDGGGGGWNIEVVASESRIGGGAAPGAVVPTWCLALRRSGTGAETLRARLLAADPPVASRVHDGRVLLDPRAVLPGDEADLDAALDALVAA